MLVSFCLVKPPPKRIYYKNEEFLKKIGANIREARIYKSISQEKLANECEIDYSQINRMELGKVNFSVSYLYRIAKALDLQPQDLLEWNLGDEP